MKNLFQQLIAELPTKHRRHFKYKFPKQLDMSILKKIFACILMTFMVGHIYAQQSNLSSATKMRIAEYKLRKNRTLRSGNAEEKQDKGVLTTILLQEGKNIPQETLDSLGVKVKLNRGKIIIGHVP